MKLLASYFPYEMSADKDGLWSFSNRHGFPVGVNLSEHDGGWDGIWDDYPQWQVQLRDLDDSLVRLLCCPDSIVEEGTPFEAESIQLYGTTSNPGASEDDMAAYLDRLRLLMETGALGTLFPYGMELQRSGAWVFFNRGYKPVGMSVGRFVRYGDWPVGVKLKDLDHHTIAGLSYTGAYDEEWAIPGQAVHFYDDGSVPTSSARKMDTYLAKLRTLMLLEGASNSRAPWRHRVARYARKTLAGADPLKIVSGLVKLLRP